MTSARWVLSPLLFLALAGPAAAVSITVGATDSGWYCSGNTRCAGGGLHFADNENYLAAQRSPNPGDEWELRNFFTFDLSSVDGVVVSASLRLFTADYFGDASELYEVYDVSTSISTLTLGGSDLSDVFNDLGTGSLYGSRSYTASDAGGISDIALNSLAISDLNSALGGEIALGGKIASLSGIFGADVEGVFASSGPGDAPLSGGVPVRQLVLEVAPIPEPTAALLFGTGFGVVGLASRKVRG